MLVDLVYLPIYYFRESPFVHGQKEEVLMQDFDILALNH